MDRNLKTTVIQSQLHWENPQANREMFSEKIAGISEKTHLIVLPEMFSTGFSMDAPKLAEHMDGPTLQWMISQARATSAAITGSIIVADSGNYYNRQFFVFPDGSFQHYDKRHTFTYAGENEFYSKGTERIIVDYKGWRICPLICYDLRFPVWSRNTEDFDVLIYGANWPKVRRAAWETLLRARAIENMVYCIGVNRVGTDGNQHEYSGNSAVYDVLGNPISKTHSGEFIETVELSKEDLEKNRRKFGFLEDRDAFQIV